MPKIKYTQEQRKIITHLSYIYYASGDVKDIWDGFDGELGEDFDCQKAYLDEPTLLSEFAKAFEIHTEQEVLDKLKEVSEFYEDIDNFDMILISRTT